MESDTTEVQTSPQNSLDANAESARRWGRFYEISSALAFSVFGALLWFGIRSGSLLEVLAAITVFVVFLCLFILAVSRADRVDTELKRVSDQSRYVVSHYRINTLEQVKAPTDVILYLRSIADPTHAITQDDLLGKLRAALGS